MFNMSSKFQVYAAVYLVLFNDDNQVLLTKRSNTGFMDGYYGLPSGHLEQGETISEALVRESKEEVNITPINFEFMRVNHRKASADNQRDYIDFYFITNDYEGELINLEPEKCSELKWCDVNELPDNIIPYIKDILQPPDTVRFFKEV
jgi:8-oxo-dGTP diphosphatase